MTAFRPVIGHPHPIEELVLLPSSGGRFEVTADGELLFSKKATQTHTTNDYVIGLVRARLEKS